MIFNNFRLTVDEEEDYKLMQIIYDRLWRGDIIELRDVLKLLLENTDITDINKEIKHKNIEEILTFFSEYKINITNEITQNNNSILVIIIKIYIFYYKNELFRNKIHKFITRVIVFVSVILFIIINI